ncbi:hypothetical protein [Egbenema bharatensis]|uniref:hypothetical protein n=1 Tax=Egbenema bharatensis TaxID=3463334 RepID=UPI003A8A57AA
MDRSVMGNGEPTVSMTIATSVRVKIQRQEFLLPTVRFVAIGVHPPERVLILTRTVLVTTFSFR